MGTYTVKDAIHAVDHVKMLLRYYHLILCIYLPWANWENGDYEHIDNMRKEVDALINHYDTMTESEIKRIGANDIHEFTVLVMGHKMMLITPHYPSQFIDICRDLDFPRMLDEIQKMWSNVLTPVNGWENN